MPDFGATRPRRRWSCCLVVIILRIAILPYLACWRSPTPVACCDDRRGSSTARPSPPALRARVAERCRASTRPRRTPGLAVVLVGDDPASAVYVRSKGKATLEAGHGELRAPPARRHAAGRAARAGRRGSTPIRRSTASSSSCRCPRTSTSSAVIAAIDPDKDVDGFHPVNAGRLAIGLHGLRALHAARLPDAAQGPARRPVGARTRW